MAIQYSEIPNNLRSPGVYVEFDSSGAGSSGQAFQALLIGLKTSSGTADLNKMYAITSLAQAKTLFGAGSLLHLMAKSWFAQGKSGVELKAMAIAETGAAQVMTIAFQGTATESKVLDFTIGGERVQFKNKVADATTNATALKNAINKMTDLFFIATSSAGTVTLTAKNKGLFGKKLSTELTTPKPKGITAIDLAIKTQGSGTPDLSAVWTAIGDEWINYFVCPFVDNASMASLTNELASRYTANRQIGARAFVSVYGTQGELTTWGNAKNSPHLAALGIKNNQLEGVVAAALAAQCSASLVNNPAAPLKGLQLVGINAPDAAAVLDLTEREVLLFDGISTYRVNNANQVLLDKIITTYQTNSSGVTDTAYLSINTPETLERIRYEQRTLFLRKYAKALLRGDDDPVSPGLILLTPKKAKGELVSLYTQMIDKGWVEDLGSYQGSLLVERDSSNKNRLNINDQPNLVNQFDILAVRSSFIL